VVVIPISISNETSDVVDAIAAAFMVSDISTGVDKSSASLGRRYSRADEIGVPFDVTVDCGNLKDNTVTLRDRDTCLQIRVLRDDVTPLLLYFVHGKINWEKASSKYPILQVDKYGDG
jgi:glycyl-tRNA synthetase